MNTRSTTPGTQPAPSSLEAHSSSIRIWHWLFFIFIFCSITTVALATFVFNTGKNIPMVQEQLQGKGVTADAAAARAVSHAFNDKLWELHTWIGIGLALEDVPFFRGIRKPIKTVHNFAQYFTYAFVLIHIGGVIWAENRGLPGLVSGMINGKKGLPADAIDDNHPVR
jgi:Ni,Fe-hydrogenase I cytochrome b subunit